MAKKPEYKTTNEIVYYKSEIVSEVDPESIALGNTKAFNFLSEGDQEPSFFVNTVKFGEDHPTVYGQVLTKEWAESFAKAVNKNPKPLYIRGHEDAEQFSGLLRAVAGGYIVGATVKDNELQLKNYILPGVTEESKALASQTKKEIKAGILSTSTGDRQKHRIEFDDNGGYKVMVIESIAGQTNALVEHDLVGSDASIAGTNFKNLSAGADRNKSQGDVDMDEKEMTTKDMLLRLKNQVDTGKLGVSDLSSGLGITVLTQSNKDDLARLKSVEDELGMTIGAYLKQVKAEKEETFSTLKENKLKAAFGDNDDLFEVAKDFFKLNSGSPEEVDVEIERIVNLKAIQTLKSAIAGSINHTVGGSKVEAKTVGILEA